MSMTFLEICSRVRQEVGGAGTGPTAVTGQTGEYKRIVDWVITADEDVQRKYDQWKFMVGNFTLNTVADDGSYAAADCVTPVTDLRDWKTRTLKIYLLSAGTAGESRMQYIEYEDWDNTYNIGTQATGRPRYFAIGNDMSLKLGPIPDAVYRISGEYQKSVDTFSASADTPVYPSEFHMLPVYAAMKEYGRYTGASELYEDGERKYNKLMREMERTQMPRMLRARPLA